MKEHSEQVGQAGRQARQAGHTPGPWRVVTEHSDDGKSLQVHQDESVAGLFQGEPDPRFVAEVVAPERTGTPEDYANARLIAAAPALLADEDFQADCRSASLPDWPEEVRCEACGQVVLAEEAERRDHDWLCSECANNVALIEEVCR